MRFSRYRAFFIISSVILGLVLYGITIFKHHGFKKSITFDGGIRISLIMPAGKGKADLEAAAVKGGLENPIVRLTNLQANQYDLELGPDIRDRIEKSLRKEEEAERQRALEKKKAETAKAGTPAAPVAKSAPSQAGPGDVQTKAQDNTVGGEIERRLMEAMPGLSSENIVSKETISASYGSNLSKIALWSLFWTLLMIGLYLSFRFDFPYALGAILALAHDLVLTVGFIGTTQIEPSIPVLAAVLTIAGYSINDTIVIFDRIRSEMGGRSLANTKEVMDLAITKTLTRTIITSLLTLISVIALLMGKAESLYDFAWVLVFGIVFGTYSSIFIASHFVQYYQEWTGRALKSHE